MLKPAQLDLFDVNNGNVPPAPSVDLRLGLELRTKFFALLRSSLGLEGLNESGGEIFLDGAARNVDHDLVDGVPFNVQNFSVRDGMVQIILSCTDSRFTISESFFRRVLSQNPLLKIKRKHGNAIVLHARVEALANADQVPQVSIVEDADVDNVVDSVRAEIGEGEDSRGMRLIGRRTAWMGGYDNY